MGKCVGLGLWWLFLAVATMIVDTVIGGIRLWVMVLVAVALASAALPLMFWGEGKVWRARNVFDLSVRDAIWHIIETTSHSFERPSLAERYFFKALHKEMCSGALLVVGSKEEGGPLKRISPRECRRLQPREVVVPLNPSSPDGVRFDLIDESALPEPPTEISGPLGFTSLRVRSHNLYRMWPNSPASTGGKHEQ